MKKPSLLLLIALMAFTTFSCSKDDDAVTTTPVVKAESKSYKNLFADQTTDYTTTPPTTKGEFIKFSFKENKIVTDDTWDVAFRGSTILVNGGTATSGQPERKGKAAAYVTDGTLTSVTTVDASKFKQDATDALAITTGSGKGWYLYDATTHITSPIAGKVLVIKTNDEKYVKMEIISYYKDAPATSAITATTPSRYYSFNYVYNF